MDPQDEEQGRCGILRDGRASILRKVRRRHTVSIDAAKTHNASPTKKRSLVLRSTRRAAVEADISEKRSAGVDARGGRRGFTRIRNPVLRGAGTCSRPNPVAPQGKMTAQRSHISLHLAFLIDIRRSTKLTEDRIIHAAAMSRDDNWTIPVRFWDISAA